ncbi:MAG: hypothetical protein Q9190_001257 [Brigantiaea leucoxantha]
MESWRDIYGFRQGHQTFIKSNFYDGGSFAASGLHSIVSERDPTEHGKMRKYLSHAFSDRSLKEQEYLVSTVVDQFIEAIGREGAPSGPGINLVTWFNLMTFDIITSLAFGEAFGGVTSGKTHFWISIVISSLTQGALADVFNRFPIVRSLFMMITPASAYEDTKKHESYTIDLVTKRINRKTDRKDFMTRILENRDKNEISDIQLAAHASDFVVAGSETTATALSAINYFLIRNPHARKLLQNEIRGRFKTYNEINASSTNTLTYTDAVCKEAMRMYAPLPLGLPRVVPEGGDTIDGHFLPGGTVVSTNPLAASLAPANFTDPLQFKPERWLGNNEKDILEASQPFSMGARGCLGRSLAWIELRTTLAKMHFKYDIKILNDNLDWHRDSEMHTLWSKPELKTSIPLHPLPPFVLPSLTPCNAGGANGIGFAAVQIFASRGATVYILDLSPPDEALPPNTTFIQCNIASWSALLSAFKTAGHVDICVANAGVSEETNYFKDTFDAEGELEEPKYRVMDVNYRAVVNFVKISLSYLRRQGTGGSIVLTTSATAYAPEHSLPVYSMSKLGLVGLVRALRPIVLMDNITINSVAPAATITKLLPKNLAAPIMAAGLPVSTSEHVGLAVAYSAVANEDRKVEPYGKDDEETMEKGGRWNGRTILCLGDGYTELEGPIADLRAQWFGEKNMKLTRMQQAATDFRADEMKKKEQEA